MCAMWSVVLLVGIFVVQPLRASGEEIPNFSRGKSIFSRVTGKPLTPRNPRYEAIRKLSVEKNWFELAMKATEDPSFITVTVRDLASYFTGRDGKQDQEFNDAQALVMGIARDHLDFRKILTADFLYTAENFQIILSTPETVLEALKRSSTASDKLHEIDRAGIFNTEAWAKTHYDGGTNRRPVQHALAVFLCTSQDEWKDYSASPRRIRQDVTRFPDLDSNNFQNKCRGCHSIMDGMAGAFASFDFREGKLAYSGPMTFMPKFVQNSQNHEEGFVTASSDWVNLATRSHNKQFGWRSPGEGIGLGAFARLIAESEAFSRCMAKRATELICQSPLEKFKEPDYRAMGVKWEENQYDIAKLFAAIAAEEKCIATP